MQSLLLQFKILKLAQHTLSRRQLHPEQREEKVPERHQIALEREPSCIKAPQPLALSAAEQDNVRHESTSDFNTPPAKRLPAPGLNANRECAVFQEKVAKTPKPCLQILKHK